MLIAGDSAWEAAFLQTSSGRSPFRTFVFWVAMKVTSEVWLFSEFDHLHVVWLTSGQVLTLGIVSRLSLGSCHLVFEATSIIIESLKLFKLFGKKTAPKTLATLSVLICKTRAGLTVLVFVWEWESDPSLFALKMTLLRGGAM